MKTLTRWVLPLCIPLALGIFLLWSHGTNHAQVALGRGKLVWHAGGQPFALSSMRGKVVVINFWATWCKPCREEMPALQRTAASEADVVVLEVDLAEDGAKVRSFVDSLGLDRLEPLLDTDTKTALRYGAISLPTTFFVDRSGVVRHLRIGQLTEQEMREGIAKAR